MLSSINLDAVRPLRAQSSKRKRMTSDSIMLFLYTVPFFLFVIAFNYIPLLGWSMSFVDYIPGVPLLEHEYVGFKHFEEIFGYGSDFTKVLGNTIAMSTLGLLVAPLPMIFAILVSEVRTKYLRKTVQTLTSLPNFVSFVIVYAIFFSFLNQGDGLVNQLLIGLHFIKEPTNLLGNPEATWYFQTFVGIWKSMGWSAIIYLGAMSAIDSQLYDAAAIDGANRFRQVLHVTIPALLPTFSVLLLLSFGNLLNGNFEQIYVFHNPLVADKIQTIDYYTYLIGLANFNFSFSTAIGVSKSLVSLILLFGINFIYKRINGHSLF